MGLNREQKDQLTKVHLLRMPACAASCTELCLYYVCSCFQYAARLPDNVRQVSLTNYTTRVAVESFDLRLAVLPGPSRSANELALYWPKAHVSLFL